MYKEIFTCTGESLPMKYLGIPKHNVKLGNGDWKSTEDMMAGRLRTWQGRMMSYWPKLFLLRSCLSNTPYFMMLMFPVPKGPPHRMKFSIEKITVA